MARLHQNPHVPTPEREMVLEHAIGKEVRRFRRQKDMTVAELARQTGLSAGMLSKIENGNISPSLTTLSTLAQCLGVPLSAFLRRFEQRREAVLTKAGDGVEVERAGTRAGHQYRLLGHLGSSAEKVVVEPYLITLKSQTDVFEIFQHSGVETIYMLEGEISYRHGSETYELSPGDTLFFEADAPHGPLVLKELPAIYLSIIAYEKPE